MSTANILTAARIIQASGADFWGELDALIQQDQTLPAQARTAVALIVRSRYGAQRLSVEGVVPMLSELAVASWEDYGLDHEALGLPTLDALKQYIAQTFIGWLCTRLGQIVQAQAALLADPATSFAPDQPEG